jgi:hypothetical protein
MSEPSSAKAAPTPGSSSSLALKVNAPEFVPVPAAAAKASGSQKQKKGAALNPNAAKAKPFNPPAGTHQLDSHSNSHLSLKLSIRRSQTLRRGSQCCTLRPQCSRQQGGSSSGSSSSSQPQDVCQCSQLCAESCSRSCSSACTQSGCRDSRGTCSQVRTWVTGLQHAVRDHISFIASRGGDNKNHESYSAHGKRLCTSTTGIPPF